ncbi:MAG TPA: protease complex subunit PrcB family protein [Anaeromyxobacteraceae bacterium]|nr:protease complex subunit PrcB family protein [Anaeromyxobacteraceae bacterium]
MAVLAAVLMAACGGATPGGGASAAPLAGTPVTATPVVPAGPRTTRSAFAGPERDVIRSADEWQAFWSRMTAGLDPAPAAPAVDFSRDMVLAAALGTRPTGGYGVAIEVALDSATLRARVTETRPGMGCMTTQALTSPVAIVRVPRSDAQVAWSDRVETRDCG